MAIRMVDQTLNLKLVAEIEKRPCLYNFHMVDYSRKDITEKAWSDIGKEVNLTALECKVRWKHLRAVMVRHLRPTSKTKKPYYLSEAMKFTIPFIKGITVNRSEKKIKKEKDVEIEYDDNLSYPNDYYELSPACYSQSGPFTAASPSSPQAYPPESPSPPLLQPKQFCSVQIENISELENNDDESYAEYYRAKKEKRDGIEDAQQESNKMFLLSLLPDLNQMNASQLRKFKKKVMDSIEDVLEGAPN